MCFRRSCFLLKFRSNRSLAGVLKNSSLAMDAAEFVMKPRPGLAIVKFWQGLLEIIIRVLSVVLAIAALITSSLALAHIQKNLPDIVTTRVNDIVNRLIGMNYNTISQNSITTGGLGIGIACLTILYEILVIILRFLNIGLINYKIKIFLTVDIIMSLLLSATYGVAGVLAAVTAHQWSGIDGSSEVVDEVGDNRISRALQLLAAVSGATLLSALVVATIMVWMILFLAKNWTKHVVMATAKNAVFG